MNCPNCQTPNRDAANFCKHCGTLLVKNCPRCNSDLPHTANFCDHCGLRLVELPGYSWWNSNNDEGASNTQVENPLVPLQIDRSPTTLTRSIVDFASSPKQPVSQSPTTDTQLEQYIPKELLTKFEGARSSGEMVGERRVVTMLFCDVIGSTAAAEHLDPEEWTEIINGALEHMISPVYKYEGIVARLMGDGILAFFGAPITHEDDPQRAVLAGLNIVAAIETYREQIKDRYSLDFNVRVGINTGLVVVGAVGSDLRMEYTALGDAINLAARMEQTALPGTVQITHDTHKLIKSMFEFEDLGGIEVKGKSEPVHAYRVLGRKAVSIHTRGIEGLYAEMVGRDTELSVLRSVVSNLKQGIGRVICVLGEAGLGKSRLVSEAKKIFKELPAMEGNWYETTSLSYETNQAYALIQRLIRRIGNIAYDDPSQTIREKLSTLTDSFTEEDRPRAKQVFEALFGLESVNGSHRLDGEAFKRDLFEVMDIWWRVLFLERPTVLVFDDVHWSDSASIELLRHLLPKTGEIPLIFIFVLRFERQSPAWQIKTLAEEEFYHRYTEISLRPLPEAVSNELLNRLLAIAELPGHLRSSILEKTGGNPFFIEEVVRTLIDSGAVVCEERVVDGRSQRYWRATIEGADFPLPDNLQALLAARIDRLEKATRGTLQLAAVIGRSFYHRVLAAVDEASPGLDKRLGTLLQLDMIREATRMPEVEYTFRNPLTQETVYQTLLLKRRREFHRRVGEAMEALYADRLEGFFGLLGYHFALAGEVDKSIQYSRKASKQAISLFAYEEAIQNLLAALELIEPGGHNKTRLVLLEDLGDVYRHLRDGEQSIRYYQQSLDLLYDIEGLDRLIPVRINRKILQVITDLKWSVSLDYLKQAYESRSAALAALKESLDSLKSESPHRETMRVLIALSNDAWRIEEPPDWELAQHYAQAAVEISNKLDSQVDRSRALGTLATVLDGRSLLREHLEVTQQRLALCRQADFDDLSESTEALRSAGAALMYVGEYEKAMPYLKEVEELAVRTRVIEQQANALGLQAQCWFRLDRWDEVLTTEEKWRDLERRYPRERVGET
jgi:predicted ATPase/class 3 adenylate cyclase